jgi:hypothetical protein
MAAKAPDDGQNRQHTAAQLLRNAGLSGLFQIVAPGRPLAAELRTMTLHGTKPGVVPADIRLP